MNNENMNGQNPQYNSGSVPPVMPNQQPDPTPVYPQSQTQSATFQETNPATAYQGPVEQPAPVMPDLSQPVTPPVMEPVYPQSVVSETQTTPTPVVTPVVEPVVPAQPEPTPVAPTPEPQVTITPTVEPVSTTMPSSQPPMQPAQSVPLPETQPTMIQPTVEPAPLQTSLPPLDALPDHIDVNGNPSPIGPAPDAPHVRKKSKLPVVLLVLILLIASFVAGQYLAHTGTFNLFKLAFKQEKKDEKKPDDTKTASASKVNEKKDYIYIADSYEIERDDTFKKEFAESNMSFKIDTPYINIDNTEMKQLNEKFQKDAETLKGLITYHPKNYSNSDKYLKTFTSSDATIYQTNDIASLVIKNESNVIPSDNSTIEYATYNIDLKTGKILENKDLLKKYKLDETKVDALAKQKLTDQGIPVCDSQTGTTCMDTNFNTAVIYVDDKGKLFTIVPLRSAMATVYQAIQLN